MNLLAARPPFYVHTAAHDHSASVGFDLRSANASRDGAFKELLLLEKHIAQEGCPECSNKHLSTAIAYLEEARTLTGGDDEDTETARELETLRPHLLSAGEDVRAIRKRLAVRLGYAG